MRASSLSFFIAVAVITAGMVWGIVMAISQNHATAPAHAHLNLLGWVSLFLFGLFYRLHPTLDASRIARAQVLIWIAGTIVIAAGVGLYYAGHPGGELYAAIGSIIVLADVLLFGWLVFKHEPLIV